MYVVFAFAGVGMLTVSLLSLAGIYLWWESRPARTTTPRLQEARAQAVEETAATIAAFSYWMSTNATAFATLQVLAKEMAKPGDPGPFANFDELRGKMWAAIAAAGNGPDA